jgi:hypothetical protein
MYLQNHLDQFAPLSFGRFVNGSYSLEQNTSGVIRVAKAVVPLLALRDPSVGRLTAIASGIQAVHVHLKAAYDSSSATELARGALLIATLVTPFFSSGMGILITLAAGAVDVCDLLKGVYKDLRQQKYPQALEKLLRLCIVESSVLAAHEKQPGLLLALSLCQAAVCVPQAWRDYQEKGGLEAAVTGLIGCIRLHQTHQYVLTMLPVPPQKEAPQELPSITITDSSTKPPVDAYSLETAFPSEDMRFNPQENNNILSYSLEWTEGRLRLKGKNEWTLPEELSPTASSIKILLEIDPPSDTLELSPEGDSDCLPLHPQLENAPEGTLSAPPLETDSSSFSSSHTSPQEPELNRLSDTVEHLRNTPSSSQIPVRLYTHIVNPEEYPQLRRIASAWKYAARNRQFTEENNPNVRERLGDCESIASGVASDCNSLASTPLPNTHFAVCTVTTRDHQQKIAGIMEFSVGERDLWVHYLVTNPQNIGAPSETKGAGSTLLKRAQLEAQLAHLSNIQLCALDRARSFYLQEGFVPREPGSSTLTFRVQPRKEERPRDQDVCG